MVGMGDVRRAAGVSHGTVSNVLNHPERVSDETRERVLAVMEELGFVRNEAARHLRSGSSNTLGLVLLDTWNPFFNDLTRGIEDSIYRDGWSLQVSTSALDPRRESQILSTFEERRVSGVLVVPTGDDSITQIERMQSRGISCVLVDRRSKTGSLSSVSVDDVVGGQLAGEHLRERGSRNVLYAGNPKVHAHAADRFRGLKEGLSETSSISEFDTATVDIGGGIRAGEYVVSLPRQDWPDAVFCANDLIAIGLMQVFTRHFVRVPDDIAIIGYDDIEFAAQTSVPLTTVRQPAYEIGVESAELLLSSIRSPEGYRPRQIVHTPSLIVRESTGATSSPLPNEGSRNAGVVH